MGQEYPFQDYFLKNILTLDPIEGVYDAQFCLEEDSGYKQCSDNKEIVILVDEDNKYRILGNQQLSFSRIGETNIYRVECEWSAARPSTVRASFVDYSILRWRIDIPPAQMKSDMGRDYRNWMKVTTCATLIKKYPTKSMYMKAAIEAQRKAEEEKKTSEWSGTGFALNNGYVVTNYHVVEDAKSINISGINGDFSVSYTASVVATDKVNDLAIVKINDSRFNGFGILPYSVEMQMAEVGDDVFVLGYPLTQTMGDEIKLTNGIISSRTGFQGDASLYQMSAPIQPGNSGGPMFNSKGNVVGIVCAHHIGAENVGYAIKTIYLKNLAESSSLPDIFPTSNTISALPLSGQVKKLKRFVYFIKCASADKVENQFK